ncbi:Crp/Fnr family transcriptional regulator [Pseudoteredinibacter isoporae]|uniref:Crp/Fnr family transcriptional regulator n=1 Tax=Pseudoteredinibacter isoporae TaxID=570281 RepID=UPI003102131F
MKALDKQNQQHYLQSMFSVLQPQGDLTEEEWQGLLPSLQLATVEPKTRLLQAGDIAHEHHYICRGLVRLFYTTPEGKELNKGFYGDGYIVGSLSALILDEPCRFSIETIEPCVVVRLPLKALDSIIQAGNGWDRLMNYSFKMMLIRNERREAELLTMTAKQRFLQFVRNFPDYLERIPQYHIASYLGISAVALSKYKRQWLAEGD